MGHVLTAHRSSLSGLTEFIEGQRQLESAGSAQHAPWVIRLRTALQIWEVTYGFPVLSQAVSLTSRMPFGPRVTSCGFRHLAESQRGAPWLQVPSIDSGEMLLDPGLASSPRGGATSPPPPAQGAQSEQAGVNPVPLHGFSRVHSMSCLLLPSRSVRAARCTSRCGFRKVQVKQFQGSATSPHPGFQATIFWGVNTNYVPLSGEKAEQVPHYIPSSAVLGVDHINPKLPIASIIFWQAGLDPKPGFIQKFGPTRHQGVLTQPAKLLSPMHSKGY